MKQDGISNKLRSGCWWIHTLSPMSLSGACCPGTMHSGPAASAKASMARPSPIGSGCCGETNQPPESAFLPTNLNPNQPQSSREDGCAAHVPSWRRGRTQRSRPARRRAGRARGGCAGRAGSPGRPGRWPRRRAQWGPRARGRAGARVRVAQGGARRWR